MECQFFCTPCTELSYVVRLIHFNKLTFCRQSNERIIHNNSQVVTCSRCTAGSEVQMSSTFPTGVSLLCHSRLPPADNQWSVRPHPAAGARGTGAYQLPWSHCRALQVLLPALAPLHGHRVRPPTHPADQVTDCHTFTFLLFTLTHCFLN